MHISLKLQQRLHHCQLIIVLSKVRYLFSAQWWCKIFKILKISTQPFLPLSFMTTGPLLHWNGELIWYHLPQFCIFLHLNFYLFRFFLHKSLHFSHLKKFKIMSSPFTLYPIHFIIIPISLSINNFLQVSEGRTKWRGIERDEKNTTLEGKKDLKIHFLKNEYNSKRDAEKCRFFKKCLKKEILTVTIAVNPWALIWYQAGTMLSMKHTVTPVAPGS